MWIPATTGRRARGCWRRSSGLFGRLRTGDFSEAGTVITAVIGDRTSDSTAESTMGSVTPGGDSTAATGAETRSPITGP
jgi:hypothetical protein